MGRRLQLPYSLPLTKLNRIQLGLHKLKTGVNQCAGDFSTTIAAHLRLPHLSAIPNLSATS